ncbi:MAG: hypothetical protein K9G76_08740 [Bacteroidales bacterium]|nr:hypothetical protein [Bacteroidales bacterium]MCF8404452.1 hypothetical protein [Bacteroidales bacterium]
MKRAIKISVWILFFAAISVLVGFISSEHQKTSCRGLDIAIDYREGTPLISVEEINKEIFSHFDSLQNKKLGDINTVEMERMVNDIDFVERAEVYSTLTGRLKVKVLQRNPLIRVMNSHNQNFYIDEKGYMMPVNLGFSSRKLVANGQIDAWYNDSTSVANETGTCLNDLFVLAGFIKKDEFLSAQIEQIYVTREQEYELVPKVGRHLIIFGDISNMEEKFSNLVTFYNEGLNKVGWDKYKTINLKYRNQVVCAKK